MRNPLPSLPETPTSARDRETYGIPADFAYVAFGLYEHAPSGVCIRTPRGFGARFARVERHGVVIGSLFEGTDAGALARRAVAGDA